MKGKGKENTSKVVEVTEKIKITRKKKAKRTTAGDGSGGDSRRGSERKKKRKTWDCLSSEKRRITWEVGLKQGR